jgi:hypothetical protein
LRFPDAEAVEDSRRNGMDKYVLAEKVFRSETWVHSNVNRWYAYVEIPAGGLNEQALSLQGCQWRFSFSRYDYTRGVVGPVISSTSPHAVADFHRQQEWGKLKFMKAE